MGVIIWIHDDVWLLVVVSGRKENARRDLWVGRAWVESATR
jgi:hypothetical protein